MSRLLISEKFFLLCIDENTGKPLLYNAEERMKWGIAGGLLISLIKLDKIGFDGDFLVLQDPTLTEDPLLNKVLKLITFSSHNQHIGFWLQQIVMEIKDLTEIIVNRLIEKEYLRKYEKSIKFGTKTIYQVVKPNFKQKIIPRLKAYLLGDKRPSFPYRGLICLIDASGLYKIMKGWDLKKTQYRYEKFRYYSKRRVKKFYFLAKLNEELVERNRLPLYI